MSEKELHLAATVRAGAAGEGECFVEREQRKRLAGRGGGQGARQKGAMAAQVVMPHLDYFLGGDHLVSRHPTLDLARL